MRICTINGRGMAGRVDLSFKKMRRIERLKGFMSYVIERWMREESLVERVR
jgi:hypothetical protein